MDDDEGKSDALNGDFTDICMKDTILKLPFNFYNEHRRI